MNAVECYGLCKRYGAKTAVDGLTLSVREGEVLALLGVNGAGKTTTIRMLSGLTQPSAGEAYVFGRSIRTELTEAKRMTGISPQETAVAGNLSVRENLVMMAGIYGKAQSEAKQAAAQMIERLSLNSIADKRAKLLSGGWQRRLSIAMALVTNPKLLILDEPTLGLDVLARRELHRVIERLRGKVTVLLTTHYIEEAEALCDRVAVMADGRLLACGTPAGLTARTGCGNLEEAFITLAEGRI